MTAWIVTVGAAQLGAADDPAGLLVARALQADGVPVASRQVVDEDETAVEEALRGALEAASLVVVLAHPGGSSGEVVRRALSRLTGARLVLNEKLLALLEEDFARRGQAMPRRLDRLALLPQGAVLWSGAGEPAWMLEGKRAAVAVLPAGSAGLASLVDQPLRTLARQRSTAGESTVLRTLHTTGLAPADAEERLGRWLGADGPVAVSCLQVDGDVWVQLRARAASRPAAEAALAPVERDVREALGLDCWGQDEETLEVVVGRLLLERRLTVSMAESCTGGLVGHRLTNIAGSSRYVERGVVVYSNQAKEQLLGVPEEMLRAHGAVSAPVAEAMAAGICRISGSACGIAVTGIAGPDGGTPAKPVGTVFIGAAAPGPDGPRITVRRFRFPGGREAVKWQSSQAALDLLRRALLSRA
ncbi:MAG TPA: nicotinamide-nucleotide amidohydrolase family protein [Verrucomicrobiae bacterium]|nr:nicotinamide-nucleotide amidohydrolase family protein [Verrucomicrobiae bacterium]